MAQIVINGWTVTALNPDGTDNSFVTPITGSVPANPTADLLDFAAMGQRLRLQFDCTISGTHSDSSTASVIGSTIRYAPAMFLAYLGGYFPPGTFPPGGYSVLIPAGYSSSYAMVLIGQGEFESANQNGTVEINLTNDYNFEIVHEFYMTMDVQSYPVGKYVPNKFRFSKNSILNPLEMSNNGVAVYGQLRGLNIYTGFQQGRFQVLAQDLSIPIQASFNGQDMDGVDLFEPTWSIELVSDPGVEVPYLSPYEDNIVIISFTDPSALIVENESEVAICNRSLDENVSGFVKDFILYEGKLITSAGSAQVSGPIYEPITWLQSAGVTTISFRVKGTDLDPSINYQLHTRAGYTNGPSGTAFLHALTTPTPTDGGPLAVDFDFISEFWTRNGEHFEEMSVAPNQRVTSVLSLNVSEYNANAASPWSTFFGDILGVRVQVFDEDDVEVFSASITDNGAGTFEDSEFIGNELDSDPSNTIQRFYLKEFRVPYTNFSGLQNWIGQTIRFRWTVQFFIPFSQTTGANYYTDNYLTVRPYENQEVSQQVSNIRFLDPVTGNPISNWCDLDSILVAADISGIANDVYIVAMVDRFPLGVQMFNDLGLEEEDPTTHTTPSYVIFSQKVSDLISDLESQPIDGGIAFLLDISTLSNDEKWRIFIEAYTVLP